MNFKIILSFAVIYIVWGSTFTAIKWGLDTFPPFLLAGLRFFVAGLAFFILARGRGILAMTKKELSREAMIGILLTTANAGVCWSEQYLSSGVAALIVGAIPVMFMLVNSLGFEKKIPSLSAVFGVMVGIVGILLISSDNSGSSSNWWVVGGLILANCSWVIGSLMIRATVTTHAYFPRAAVQLISGSIFLFITSFLMGERSVPLSHVGFTGYASVAYLSLMGTILAYTCYSFLLKNVRPEITSTYALVNPLVAMIFGVLWLNEPFTVNIAISTSFILLSVVLVLYGNQFVQTVQTKIFRIRKVPAEDLKKCG